MMIIFQVLTVCAQHRPQHHPSLCAQHHPQHHSSLCPAPSSVPPSPRLISFDPMATYEGRRDDLYSWLQSGCVKAHRKNKGLCLAAIFCATSLHLSSGAERMGMLLLKAFVGIELGRGVDTSAVSFHLHPLPSPASVSHPYFTGDSLSPLPLLSHTNDIYEATTVE